MNTFNQNMLNNYISYLRKDKFKNKIQELDLVKCNDEYGDYILLTSIQIKPSQRRLGYGSAIIDMICSYCDNNNLRIKINQSDLNLKKLIPFYRKHGFILIDDELLLYKPIKK